MEFTCNEPTRDLSHEPFIDTGAISPTYTRK